jgi:hypothetical protein
MHVEHRLPHTLIPHSSTAISLIETAPAEIDLLNPKESPCYIAIASEHAVDRSTLTRRHRAVTKSRAAEGFNQQKFNLHQGRELIKGDST